MKRSELPTPDEWLRDKGRSLEIQTDKDLVKVVPCNYAGCSVDLMVNTYYAPHKAKCSEHSTKRPTAITSSRLVHVDESVESKPNGALVKLLCPLCTIPMRIKAINEETGWITFICLDGFGSKMKDIGKLVPCMTAVHVRPNWKAMEMSSIPEKWKPIAENFNLDAIVAYFDIAESRRNAAIAICASSGCHGKVSGTHGGQGWCADCLADVLAYASDLKIAATDR